MVGNSQNLQIPYTVKPKWCCVDVDITAYQTALAALELCQFTNMLILIYHRVLGQTTWMHASFWWELIILSHACLDTYFDLSPINHLYISICRNFIRSKILSSNISCSFIYNANGMFTCREFHRSCPSAGNKKIFTLSVFLLGACVYIVLPGTQWYELAKLFLCKAVGWLMDS